MTVAGTVSVMRETPQRIRAARLKFSATDGSVVEVTANEIGEYQIFLKPEREYRITMMADGFCELHRPAFMAEPGATLMFGFLTAVGGSINRRSVVLGHAYKSIEVVRPDRSFPYCDEETISFGEPRRDLIIAYGIFSTGEDSDIYDALPISTDSGQHLPVTISYQSYTIRATKAEFNRSTKVLTAEGNVSIEDGSSSPPLLASCVKLRLQGEPPDMKSARHSRILLSITR